MTTGTEPATRTDAGFRPVAAGWAKYRKKYGFESDRELARAMGVSRVTVYRVLSGVTSPGERFIAKTLTLFPHVRCEELFEPWAVELSAARPVRRP